MQSFDTKKFVQKKHVFGASIAQRYLTILVLGTKTRRNPSLQILPKPTKQSGPVCKCQTPNSSPSNKILWKRKHKIDDLHEVCSDCTNISIFGNVPYCTVWALGKFLTMIDPPIAIAAFPPISWSISCYDQADRAIIDHPQTRALHEAGLPNNNSFKAITCLLVDTTVHWHMTQLYPIKYGTNASA